MTDTDTQTPDAAIDQCDETQRATGTDQNKSAAPRVIVVPVPSAEFHRYANELETLCYILFGAVLALLLARVLDRLS